MWNTKTGIYFQPWCWVKGHCTLSWWPCSLLNYTPFASSSGVDTLPCLWQAAAFLHWCLETQNYWPGEKQMSWSQLCWVTPEPAEHPVEVILQESNGTCGSHWLLLLLKTFGECFLLSKVCDKYLVALWGFWVKMFGKQWLIVLGLWWVTWTFRACSLNKGQIQGYPNLHISAG